MANVSEGMIFNTLWPGDALWRHSSASTLVYIRSAHDDVINWKHFPRYWPLVWGIHRPPVNSPHKGQWRGALIFLWSAPVINGWVNNREAGGHRTHFDVTVMANVLVLDIIRMVFREFREFRYPWHEFENCKFMITTESTNGQWANMIIVRCSWCHTKRRGRKDLRLSPTRIPSVSNPRLVFTLTNVFM